MQNDFEIPGDDMFGIAAQLKAAQGAQAAQATAVLAGYDMIVQITEDEINSQFGRLYGNQISAVVTANGVTTSGFGGTTYTLGSCLRGAISPPKVALATLQQPLQTRFYFNFQAQPLTPGSMTGVLPVTQDELDTAFKASPDGTNAVLYKTEAVPYKDANGSHQTLSAQVGYWITRTQTKVGSVTSSQYSLTPAIKYNDSTAGNVMISLAGLQLSFQVLLDKMPATPDQIRAQVQSGVAPQELLDTIKNNGFDAQAFALEQLFLNFDTTDFTQWTLTDPAGGLGPQVTYLNLNSDGSCTAGSMPLDQVIGRDQSFSTQLSVALQYAFGFGGKNTAGASPYIIGVSVSSTDPAATDSNQQPSLVPTDITYSTTASPTVGLSALTYQVMGGVNGAARVPRNNDSSLVNVTTNTVTTNDFSGELLYARSVFFDPFILQPIQNGISQSCGGDALSWTQSGDTWTAARNWTDHPVHDDKTVLKTGPISDVYNDYDDTYTIQAKSDGTVLVSGNTSLTVRIEIELSTPLGGPTFRWSKVGTQDWTRRLTMSIDQQNNGLTFTTSDNFPAPTIGDTQENFGAKLTDAVTEVFNKLSAGHFDTMSSAMSRVGDGISNRLSRASDVLGQNLGRAARARFVSPSGKVFLLNAPRYNAEFDLQMDVTYAV